MYAMTFAGAFFFMIQEGKCSPLNNPADFLSEKSWFVSAVGQSIKKQPILEISNVNDVQVPLTSGSSTIFSGSNIDVETESKSESMLVLVGLKPREALEYHFKIGQVRNYKIEFSSGSHFNTLDALSDGIVWGFGLSGRISPASIVSMGITWQLDYSRSKVDLDRFQSPGILTSSNISYQEEEIQGALNFSRRWKTFEPYAGLKILRTIATMVDQSTKGKIKGSNDGVSPFVGIQWDLADRESIVLEGSFADEESFSASMKVQF